MDANICYIICGYCKLDLDTFYMSCECTITEDLLQLIHDWEEQLKSLDASDYAVWKNEGDNEDTIKGRKAMLIECIRDAEDVLGR